MEIGKLWKPELTIKEKSQWREPSVTRQTLT